MESTKEIENFSLQRHEVEEEPRNQVRPQDAEEVVEEQKIMRTDQNFRKYLIRSFHKNLDNYRRFYFVHLTEDEIKEYQAMFQKLTEQKVEEKIKQIEKETDERYFSKPEFQFIQSLSFIQKYAGLYNLQSTRLALKKINGGLSRKKNKKSDTQGVKNATFKKLFAENENNIVLTKRNERNRHALKNMIGQEYLTLLRNSKLKQENYMKNYAYLFQVFSKLDEDGNFFKKFKINI